MFPRYVSSPPSVLLPTDLHKSRFSSSFGKIHPWLSTAPQSHNLYRGFAYGLLDVLNPHFQTSLNITAGRASGLSAAYFGAYFLCPPTISGWILRKWGFRVTFMSGLAILSVGCLLMWYLDSFPIPLKTFIVCDSDLDIPGLVESSTPSVASAAACSLSAPVFPPSRRQLIPSCRSAVLQDTLRSVSISRKASKPSVLLLLLSWHPASSSQRLSITIRD